MSSWGTTNEQKPKFPWLVSGGGATTNNLNKVYATEQGWVYKWPWGEEILVGIGGLATLMGAPTSVAVESITTGLTSTNPGTVQFRVVWNEPLIVTGTPSIVAIGDGGAANVTLVYDASLSEPLSGRLVFSNTTVDLSGTQGGTLTVNATSGGLNFTNYTDITDKTNVAVTITSTIVGSNTITIATASASASPSPSASKSPSASASPSASSSSSASPSVSPSASASPSASKSPSASASPSVSPSASGSASSSASKSPSASTSPSASPSPTNSL